MRVLTIVNLALWCLLFAGWVPFLLMFGLADRVSTQVMWILIATAVLQAALFALRARNKRPVLG